MQQLLLYFLVINNSKLIINYALIEIKFSQSYNYYLYICNILFFILTLKLVIDFKFPYF